MVLLALAACAPEAVGLPGGDAAPDARFADLAGLADGTIVRDAAPPPPDAARLNDAGEVCLFGSTSGIVCTPDGTPIIDAEVVATTRDCEGRPLEVTTRADETGRFRLDDLAPGPASITVRSGSFLAAFDVEIIAGVTVRANGGISDKICLSSRAARLAVLTGQFDRIQDTLTTLGFAHDLYCGETDNHVSGRSLLGSLERMQAYDVLFINCASGIDFRATNPEVRAMIENLRAFVAQGGSLYVSDLAADVIEQAWPEALDFELHARAPSEALACCVCSDCGPECVADERPPRGCEGCCPEPNTMPLQCVTGGGIGGSGRGGVVDAHLVAPYLQAALGATEVPVVFNLGGWVPVASWDPQVQVLVEDLDGRPLMAMFEPTPGGGRVAFTSFHHHAQATEAMTRLLAALVLRL